MRQSVGFLTLMTAVVVNLAISAAGAATIYVDNKLKADCQGNYSVRARDATGNDGDAYKTLVEAANIAKAGDTVLIRAGVYNSAASAKENDVLWPKNSGQPGKPITFKAYKGEAVVLGDANERYPGWDDQIAIAGGTITLKDVSQIVIEDIQVRKVTGWIFARNCDHVTIRNCIFADALHTAKGTARLLETHYFVMDHCTFSNSSGDALQMEVSDHNVVQDCTFNRAAHALLAIRGSSFNVIRNCKFDNPFYEKTRSEKLVEVYDVKLDRRDPDNPSHEEPAYDSTRYNLFERNFFGYHPFRPDKAAQPSAMQYSGQNGTIRRNVFCNPIVKRIDPDNPDAVPGGMGITLRWGGSWDGWNANRKVWIGEGIEAGYVTGNRVFSNTFYGYDNGCVALPAEDAVKNIALNPPPMEEANPPRLFDKKFAFEDNQFINNIFVPGVYNAHTTWAWQKHIAGLPVAVVSRGMVKEVQFVNNDFFATGDHKDALIYFYTAKYLPPVSSEQMGKASPDTFKGNVQKDPMFVDLEARNFQLKDASPMIDAGMFLTTAVGAGKESRTLVVKDAGFFFDGFGIEGQKGDVIQLKDGNGATARIVAIDYKTNTLRLDKPLSWQDGQGVSLPFGGAAPDIGAFENGVAGDQAVGPGAGM